MRVLCFEGYVENGCIPLPAGLTLPDKTKVYVIVPGVPDDRDFIKEVTDINEDQSPKT